MRQERQTELSSVESVGEFDESWEFGRVSASSVYGSWEVVVMPGGKRPGPSVKRPAMYEALRKKGFSKRSAARISNASRRTSRRSK